MAVLYWIFPWKIGFSNNYCMLIYQRVHISLFCYRDWQTCGTHRGAGVFWFLPGEMNLSIGIINLDWSFPGVDPRNPRWSALSKRFITPLAGLHQSSGPKPRVWIHTECFSDLNSVFECFIYYMYLYVDQSQYIMDCSCVDLSLCLLVYISSAMETSDPLSF